MAAATKAPVDVKALKAENKALAAKVKKLTGAIAGIAKATRASEAVLTNSAVAADKRLEKSAKSRETALAKLADIEALAPAV